MIIQQRTTMMIVFFAVATIATACKEVKVGLDDNAQNTLDCLTGKSCDSSGSSSSGSNSGNNSGSGSSSGSSSSGSSSGSTCYGYECNSGGSSGSSSSGSNSGNNSSSGSSSGSSSSGSSVSGSSSGSSGSSSGSSTVVDPADSTGGIEELPTGRKGSSRFFMGTYSLDSGNYGGSMASCASDGYNGNSYDVPAVIRAFSYDNAIDFEDNFGNLDWVATVFPDDTFDFQMQFLDGFGRRSNTVACTCAIEVPYSWSDKEEIKCTCDPTSINDDMCTLTYDSM